MMIKNYSALFIIIFVCGGFLTAQKPGISYYLPDVQYNSSIPTPASILGFEPGEWHISHDQLIMYLRILDESSERIKLDEYARSHENRPLIYLSISDPENLSNIESIRKNHLKLCNPEESSDLNIDEMPGIIYQGYSIHGDESSGSNAAVYVAYYLAAAEDSFTKNLLKNTVILLDPSCNPDGMQRFASWVNSNRSIHMNGDPSQRELNEVWPTGRTNHYWFDLNRDWLLLTHPESRGRINTFHKWKPDILTDHHEMGSNSTFFFQPGVPSRANPNTPDVNQQLTEEIGRYHAKALDSIASMYYSKESFDDFYYGKGSTYPDANGSIGILFEQASSAGHKINTTHGSLSFPFTIRNQVVTSLSTQKAAFFLRTKLLEFKRNFYKTAIKEAEKSQIKAYVFGREDDSQKLNAFINILNQHKIEIHHLAKDFRVNSQSFTKENAYIVPLKQNQYRLAKTLFETVDSFEDSLFYDVSAWTLPFAFDIPFAPVTSEYKSSFIGDKVTEFVPFLNTLTDLSNPYGYIIDWGQFQAPKLLYNLLNKGIQVKVLHQTTHVQCPSQIKEFPRGSLLIMSPEDLGAKKSLALILANLAQECQVQIYEVTSGLTEKGIDLGSPSASTLRKPNVCLLVGQGVSGYEAGEIWHCFDQKFNIPISLVDLLNFGNISLSNYNVLILTDGNYGSLSESQIEKIKNWIESGGTLIVQRGAISWAVAHKLITVKSKMADPKDFPKNYSNYENLTKESGAQETGGAIMEATMDLTHPLCYGYDDSQIHLFRKGNYFMEVPELTISAPVKYTEKPLVSGYMSPKNQNAASNSASVLLGNKGKGQVIAFADNLNFRGYWYGGTKMFMNAIFFAPNISSGAMLD